MLGRLIEALDNATESTGIPTGNKTQFEYDGFDNRITTFAYDNLDRLRVVNTPGDTLAETLAIEFRYDPMENVTAVIAPNNGASSRTTTYAYDALSRLRGVTQPSGAASTITYECGGAFAAPPAAASAPRVGE